MKALKRNRKNLGLVNCCYGFLRCLLSLIAKIYVLVFRLLPVSDNRLATKNYDYPTNTGEDG